jgi:hypothetical protein
MARWLLGVVTIILGFLLAACNQYERLSGESIRKVLENPRNYEGKIITLSGTVADATSLLLIKAFVLEDATGQLYVITDRILPKKGDRLRVRGEVVEVFSFGDQTLTVFREQPVQ